MFPYPRISYRLNAVRSLASSELPIEKSFCSKLLSIEESVTGASPLGATHQVKKSSDFFELVSAWRGFPESGKEKGE